MPCQDVDDVSGIEGMNSLTGLSASDVDTLVAVLVHTMGAADVCAVEAEGQAVDTTGHV